MDIATEMNEGYQHVLDSIPHTINTLDNEAHTIINLISDLKSHINNKNQIPTPILEFDSMSLKIKDSLESLYDKLKKDSNSGEFNHAVYLEMRELISEYTKILVSTMMLISVINNK